MRTVSLTHLPQDLLVGHIFAVNQYWKGGSSWNFFEHPREKHGFMHVLCPRVDIAYPDGRAVSFPAGSLLYIPKHCRYWIDFIDTADLYAAGLAADRIVNFDLRGANGEAIAFADEIICLGDPISQRASGLMEQTVYTCMNVKDPLIRATRCFCELLEVLSTEAAHPGLRAGSRRKSAVAPAVLYLDSHVSSVVSIPELAQMCLLSTSAFRAAFRAYTGMSPVQYRIQTKIRKAEQLLCGSDEPSVKEIAEELGFCDCTYFCRLFRKATGVSPSEYRQSRRE